MNNKLLQEFCDKIVEAHLNPRVAQQMSPDQIKQQEQSAQVQSTQPPQPTNPNAAPQAPKAVAPQAPKAPVAEAPKAPVAPTATNPNPAPVKPEEVKPEAETPKTTQPETVALDPNNELAKDYIASSFSGLVKNAINNSLTIKRKAFEFFNDTNIKKSILDEMNGKHCIIQFIGSEDKFPAKMDSSSYDSFVDNGLTNIFDVVDDKTKKFSISVTSKDDTIISHVKTLASAVCDLGFSCVVSKNEKTYNIQFTSKNEIDTTEIFNVVLEQIEQFASIVKEETIFDASELTKGNLKDISRFAPLHKIMEL
ncbi:MAG TPA: hypothetical protein VMX17_16905 [Candidatus Glassbacteria bacterium]|nr:hypothetical protein [Candidatus Glassbacteria bacterium]